MRWIVMFVCALCVACQTPGFTSAGVSWMHPELDRMNDLDGGPVAIVGGGFKASELTGDRFENPIHASDAAERRGVYLEAFAGYGDDIDEASLALLGAGTRVRFGSEGQWFVRAGGAYANVDSGGNELGGPYVGVGYDFYLNDAHTVSLTPDLTFYGLFDSDDFYPAGSAGISLTWFWGSSRKPSGR